VEPEVPEPSFEEIKSIVESLKNNKAPGENKINPELLKLAGRDLLENLHKTILTIWEQEKLEKGWNTVIICSIYKKRRPQESRKLPWHISFGHCLQGLVNSHFT
jgi:hypothetical protein